MTGRHTILLDEDTIDSDPRLRRAVMIFVRRLTKFMGEEFTGSNVARMIEMARDMRAHFVAKGINFPPLVPLVLDSLGTVDFFRADLDSVGVQAALRQTVQKYHGRGVDPRELAFAARCAWPSVMISEADVAIAKALMKKRAN